MDWDKIYNKLRHAKKLIDDVPNQPIEKFEIALMDAATNLYEAIHIAELMKEKPDTEEAT